MKAQKKANYYEASAYYDDNRVVVLKGSKVAEAVNPSYRLSEVIIEIRQNEKLVDRDGILKENIEFPNPSRAACFVAGYSVNGLNAWRTKDGISLKNLKEQNNG